MAGQIETYRNEIFNFLRTCTIKFEPFAYVMGKSYMEQHGLVDPNDTWNPYYINLSGEYSSTDTKMEVYSPETESMVPYDKNLKYSYPKTAALYTIPRKEYRTLEDRYPTNIGLIRTIAYPAGDIHDIIDAPNLTLLGYDSTLLHVNERESMLATLRNFLDMVRVRWYVAEYSYEDLYAPTFWALMWQHLPVLLLTQRFKNILTPNVHPFHIWEYLMSKGLGDYRDVLSNNQSLWLYRNINWILANKGKEKTLFELANNLLKEVFVSLLYKDMSQSTEDFRHTCITTPEFRSFNIVTGEEVKLETFAALNHRLVNESLEHRDDLEYTDHVSTQLGEQPYNRLMTKFLEFKKDPIDSRNEQLMVKSFLDTLIYRLSTNDMTYSTVYQDRHTGISIKFTLPNLVLFWYYVLHKSVGDVPTSIPKKYRCHLAFKNPRPDATELEPYITYHGHKCNLNSVIDIHSLLSSITPHRHKFSSRTDFMEYATEHLRLILALNRCMEQSNLLLYHLGMQSFFHSTMYNGWLDTNLTDVDTYEEWFRSHGEELAIITAYDQIEDEDERLSKYENLSNNIFDTIFTVDTEKYPEFRSQMRNIERIYTSIRNLFIQLCSYNVVYLETARDKYSYMKILEYDFYTDIMKISMGKLVHLLIPGLWLYFGDPSFSWFDRYYLSSKFIQYISLYNKTISYDVQLLQMHACFIFHMDINYVISNLTSKWYWSRTFITDYSRSNTKHAIGTGKPIRIHGTSISKVRDIQH